MNTEELLNVLTYFHLQEFSSGRELIQALEEDDYARQLVAPAGGIKRSTFFDTVNERGIEQLLLAIYCHEQHGEHVFPFVACDNFATRFVMRPCNKPRRKQHYKDEDEARGIADDLKNYMQFLNRTLLT